MLSTIKDINARQIFDSRGNPTVEVDITLSSGAKGRASVPSGASTGKYEAHELRDEDGKYHGKGVTKAVNNIKNIIAPTLIGKDASDQNTIDKTMCELDGTKNKVTLGANSILGVSLANAHAMASNANRNNGILPPNKIGGIFIFGGVKLEFVSIIDLFFI